MLEVLKNTDALAIIKSDHEKVKDLFKQFEHADDLRSKKKIAAEAIQELKIHAEIEEKIFYPSVRKSVEKDLMNEADEEHHVAKLLIAELDQMSGNEDHWEAKFTVLAENVRHHIKEEEGEMLPQTKKISIDMNAIGKKMLALKEKLQDEGVPPCDEDRLMAKNKRADSPATAAKLKAPARAKAKPSGSKKATAKKTTSAKKAPASKQKTAAEKSPAARKASAKKPARSAKQHVRKAS